MNGRYTEWFDNGDIWVDGHIKNGKRDGEWTVATAHTKEIGKYTNAEKNGEWITYDDKERLKSKKYYSDDLLDGNAQHFDTLGNLIYTIIYEKGEELETIYSPAYEAEMKEKYPEGVDGPENMPRFPGCDHLLTEEEKKECANRKMLEFIYKNIRYPNFAREWGIEGTALVNFVIKKDGSVADIKILRGICDPIASECYRVVAMMPDWIPGMQRGKPVKVYFNLPIKFRLQ